MIDKLEIAAIALIGGALYMHIAYRKVKKILEKEEKQTAKKLAEKEFSAKQK